MILVNTVPNPNLLTQSVGKLSHRENPQVFLVANQRLYNSLCLSVRRPPTAVTTSGIQAKKRSDFHQCPCPTYVTNTVVYTILFFSLFITLVLFSFPSIFLPFFLRFSFPRPLNYQRLPLKPPKFPGARQKLTLWTHCIRPCSGQLSPTINRGSAGLTGANWDTGFSSEETICLLVSPGVPVRRDLYHYPG